VALLAEDLSVIENKTVPTLLIPTRYNFLIKANKQAGGSHL
jgi:hypothetical protein